MLMDSIPDNKGRGMGESVMMMHIVAPCCM